MKKLNSLFSSVIIITILSGCSGQDEVFYISPGGDDSNKGTIKHPFATIEKARDVIRNHQVDNPSRDYKVFLREGTYYLSEPVAFTDKDGGKDGNHIDYKAYKDEKVTLSGALLPECNWQEYENGIYMCELPELADKNFTQLFVNGKRQIRARYPNGNSGNPDINSFIFPLKADEWPHQKIYYDPETFTHHSWKRPEEAVMHIFPNHHWGNMQYEIEGINYEEDYFLIRQRDPQINETYFHMMSRPGTWISERSNYFVENIFEELDIAGEWYFDKKESVLYYKPSDTLDIHTAVFEVPGLKELIILKGTKDLPVKNLSFENIRFTGTQITYMDPYEYPSLGDWGIVRSGAVFIEGAKDIGIRNCFFDAVGGNAVFINKYVRSVNVEGNIFSECGESAICLVGESHLDTDGTYKCKYCGAEHPWAWDEPSEEIPSECTIHNNLIHDIGIFGKQVAGVFLAITKKNKISNNHIYNTPRAAICLNDGWHGGHVIEYNDIYNTVRETGDHGPLNSWGRESSWCHRQSHEQGASHPAGDVLSDAKFTTIIRNNRFTDNSGWGIDLDDGSSNYHVCNNLCIGVSVKLREGDYRTVENNIFYKGANPPSIHRGYENNQDIFRKNIVVVDTLRYNPTEDINFRGGTARERVFHFIAPPEESKWIAVLDSNLYYSSSGNFKARMDAGGRNTVINNKDIKLEEWKELGFDQHSVLADPMFEDPEKGDFRLKEGSPAFKTGFKEFPLNDFGLTEDFSNAWALKTNE